MLYADWVEGVARVASTIMPPPTIATANGEQQGDANIQEAGCVLKTEQGGAEGGVVVQSVAAPSAGPLHHQLKLFLSALQASM
jgi:hypothetical protein